jgi:hypothetical protein
MSLSCFMPLVAFVACIPLILYIERRRRRHVINLFLRDRQPLPDGDYLKAFADSGLPAEGLLQARKAMARLCGVPPEMLSPGDTVRSLLDLQFDSGWIEDFLFDLESPPNIKTVRAAVRVDWTFRELVCFVMGSARAE